MSLQIIVDCEFARMDFSVVEFKLECTDWCVMGLAEQYSIFYLVGGHWYTIYDIPVVYSMIYN